MFGSTASVQVPVQTTNTVDGIANPFGTCMMEGFEVACNGLDLLFIAMRVN